ncbi:MAG: DUF1109 family protein [Variibacter sp.]|nr:DUF1109 family protein [Variibacter sp.]
MKTDQLIRTLAADQAPRGPSPGQRLAVGLLIATAVSLLLLLATLGPRPGLLEAMREPRFLLKFPVTLGLAAAAAGAALRLSRPAVAAGPWALGLLAGPALLAAGVAVELLVMPRAAWMPRLVGHNPLLCLASIPLLAAPVLLALFAVLRSGAPTRPALAGALAGLLAGGVGAALYALHCVDDSPLFVATWYTAAVAALTVVGAALGARLLRW